MRPDEMASRAGFVLQAVVWRPLFRVMQKEKNKPFCCFEDNMSSDAEIVGNVAYSKQWYEINCNSLKRFIYEMVSGEKQTHKYNVALLPGEEQLHVRCRQNRLF